MNTLRRKGFTLIEMMAVIAIIALISALILPAAAKLFTASADEQARQMLSAMLAGARAKAIEHAEYRIVHVQVGKEGSTWICAMAGRDEGLGRGMEFGGEGFLLPRRIPGHVAFGGIDPRFLMADGEHYSPDLTDTRLEDFTSFNIGFGPDGTLVTGVGPVPFILDRISPVFGWGGEAIWKDCPQPEYGVRAVTYFPYPKVKPLPPVPTRPNEITRTMYLNDNAQFLALSPLTGRVMDAK